MSRRYLGVVIIVFVVACFQQPAVEAQLVVPGMGTQIHYVGDDFEDPDWRFIDRLPKSSRENDGYARSPLGYAANRRWAEGPERGHPDRLEIIPTPANGLPGSEHSLLMQTRNSGVPGRNSFDVQQDDLIVNCQGRLGSSIRVSEMPNCLVRVFLPPPEQWENRSGPHFGFRSGLSSAGNTTGRGFFGALAGNVAEPYWPGIWIHFRSETSRRVEQDSAFLKVRGDRSGRDFRVLEIEEFGWWTLGMSFTGDGKVHFFASPGVEPLTEADHLTSQYPYSFEAARFRTFFFNACNRNDGKTWSTPFALDDPQLFVVNAERVASLVERKERARERAAAAKAKTATTKTR